MTTRKANVVMIAMLACFVLTPTQSTAQDVDEVPWYEPTTTLDQAPPEPQRPVQPLPQPKTRAFQTELGPLFYFGSDPVSGTGSFLKFRLAIKHIGMFAGFLLPAGVFSAGVEFNPLGGLPIPIDADDISFWLLGPRSTLLLALDLVNSSDGLGGAGMGVQFAPVGARVAWCGPTCFIADLRPAEFTGLLYVNSITEDTSFLKSIGFNLSAGLVF